MARAADYYKTLGSTRRPPRRRSRRRTASSRASTTRTRTRTPGPRSASRRSPRPTTSSATPRSARSTTAAAPCSAAADPFGGGAPAAARRAADFGSFSDILSGIFNTGGGAAARARSRRPSAAATSRRRSRCPSSRRSRARRSRSRSPRTRPARPAAAPAREPGTSPIVCPVCHGRGVESQGQGLFSITRPCSRCGGSGTVIEEPCPTCGGEGRLRELKKYRVNIPAGRQGGLAHPAAPARARRACAAARPATCSWSRTSTESPVFKRKGDNFEVEVPITVAEALARRRRRGPDAARHQEAARPAGHASTARVQRLRGEGPPMLGGARPGRHPLPLRDRRARATLSRRAARGASTSSRRS